MSYHVFLVAYLGAPRNHHALFVETDSIDQSGILFHVVGDIQRGMTYEEKFSKNPATSANFVNKSSIGYINISDLDNMRSICYNNPPPKKQFNGPKRLYPKEPLRRCQEWTNETIDALTANGVLASALADEASATEEYWTWSDEYNNWYHVYEDGSIEWSGEQYVDESREGKAKAKGKGKGKKA